MPNQLSSALAIACFLATAGCGPSTDAKSPDESAEADGATTADMSGPDEGAESSGSEATSKSNDGETKPAGGGEAPPKNEKPKEPNALVLDLAFMMKGGGKVDATTTAELKKAAAERIAASTILARAGAKIEKPRPVEVTVMLDEPTEDKKGLTVKMGLVGVEPGGKCPVFDVDQNFTMSDAKKSNAEHVLELRRMAIQALLEKLEQSAPTLKPDANCTAFKKK